MAKAEKRPPVDFEVVLTLSSEEAKYLWSVLRAIGGGGALRKINDEISDELSVIYGRDSEWPWGGITPTLRTS